MAEWKPVTGLHSPCLSCPFRRVSCAHGPVGLILFGLDDANLMRFKLLILTNKHYFPIFLATAPKGSIIDGSE